MLASCVLSRNEWPSQTGVWRPWLEDHFPHTLYSGCLLGISPFKGLQQGERGRDHPR